MTSAPPSARRRPYTTHDYKHVAQHYSDHTAAECAAALNRTRGSLYTFISRYPELRKHAKF